MPHSTSRRYLMAGSAVIVACLLAVAGYSTHLRIGYEAHIELYFSGVHVTSDGQLATIPAGTEVSYLPNSRVLEPGADASADEIADADSVAAEHAVWLEGGTIPGQGTEFEDLGRQALLDLMAHHSPNLGPDTEVDDGAVIAAMHTRWAYVWPRDAAFAAVALAQAGHIDDAVSALAAFIGVPRQNGLYHARYLPDMSGPPDTRAPQGDGAGWLLWATEQVAAAASAEGPGVPGGELAQDVVHELLPLVDEAMESLELSIDSTTSLPLPTPDYWEVDESELTLGVAAVTVAGLESGSRLLESVGQTDQANSVGDLAEDVRGAVVGEFGETGYQRYANSTVRSRLMDVDGRDTAAALTVAPFIAEDLAGAEGVWQESMVDMARPAGGLAPGSTWRRDGISWTPETSLYAWVAAVNGEPETAIAMLEWLTDHRTDHGAIPEKVLADGTPAAVAPLVWSSANVVLALLALEEAGSLDESEPWTLPSG